MTITPQFFIAINSKLHIMKCMYFSMSESESFLIIWSKMTQWWLHLCLLTYLWKTWNSIWWDGSAGNGVCHPNLTTWISSPRSTVTEKGWLQRVDLRLPDSCCSMCASIYTCMPTPVSRSMLLDLTCWYICASSLPLQCVSLILNPCSQAWGHAHLPTVLVKVSVLWWNTMTKNNIGRKGFITLKYPESQFMQGSQCRDSNWEGIWRQELMQRPLLS